jgi:L-fuculose-phosphate aldolase
MTAPLTPLPICLMPIGIVHQRSETESILALQPEFVDGLLGITEGDTLQVLYWMHQLPASDRARMQAHPRGDTTRPRCGVFALRCPMRPNPIGVTIVVVKHIMGNQITVTELDALDGSPILDIKAGQPPKDILP